MVRYQTPVSGQLPEKDIVPETWPRARELSNPESKGVAPGGTEEVAETWTAQLISDTPSAVPEFEIVKVPLKVSPVTSLAGNEAETM